MSTSPENVKSAIQNSPLLWEDVRGKIHVCKAQTSKVMGYKSKTARGKASERCTHQPRAFTTKRERERGNVQYTLEHLLVLCSPESHLTVLQSIFCVWLYCLLIQIVEQNYWTWSESFITDAPSSQEKKHGTIQIVYSSHITISCHNLFLLKFPI